MSDFPIIETKPTSADLREQYRAARWERRLAEERARAAAVSAQTAVLAESLYAGAGFGEAWGDFVNPLARFPHYEGFRMMGFGHETNPHDRQRGTPYTAFSTIEELREIWATSRQLADRNAFFVGALRGLTGYVVRTGFTSNAVLRQGVKESEENKTLRQSVQSELDAFDQDSEWPEIEAEVFRLSRVAGEYTLRHFAPDPDDDPDSILQVRPIEPECIVNPPKVEDDREWSLGVKCDPGDTSKPIALGVDYEGSSGEAWDEVPIHECEVFKLNVPRSVRRGLSDFFCLSEAGEELRKMLRSMRKGGTILANIAWWEKYTTATKSEVQAMEDGLAAIKVRRVSGVAGGASQEVRYKQIDPGAIIKTDADREIQSSPLASNTPYFAEIIRLSRQAFALRWNAPESFLGDASNGAYASLAVAESPFVVTAEAEQWFYARRFRRTKIRAIKHAIRCGRLPEDTLRKVDVEVYPPSLVTRNRQEAATVNSTKLKDGTTSPQRVAQEDGEDWEQIQQERQAAVDAGWTPPTDPAMGGALGATEAGIGGMLGEHHADPFAWLRDGE